MHVIEGSTVTAMGRNTSQIGKYSKWLPMSQQVTFKMGPDLKVIVLVYRIIVQNVMFLPQNAQTDGDQNPIYRVLRLVVTLITRCYHQLGA